jgi:FkbM family methyltransferase
MNIHKLADKSYGAAREIVGTLGLMGLARRFLGPVIGRILYRLSPGGSGPVQLNGNSMYLAPTTGYPPLAMANGRYEPSTTLIFQETLQSGMVVIDIGAHVGYYTLLAAKLVGPTGKVYAFEPAPGNHDTLLKNIELNNYSNITATKMALSDQKGNATIYLSGLDTGRHSLYQHGLPERGSTSVETTTLDYFLESEGWPHVDVIKVDVEGAEVAVLDGMARLLDRSPELKLFIEFNPALLKSAGVTPTSFLGKVRAMGFQISSIDDSNGLLPMAAGDDSELTDRLLAADNSVNLFGARN